MKGIRVYRYSQLERLHYLRPVDDSADPSEYGEPNLGYFFTDADLAALKQELLREGFELAAKWYVEIDKRDLFKEDKLRAEFLERKGK